MLQVVWVTDMGSARSYLQTFTVAVVICQFRKFFFKYHFAFHSPFAHCYPLLCELTEAYSLILLTTNPTVTTEGLTSEVQAKAGSSVELECRLPSSDPAVVSSASQHVVEWIRQGFDIPVLIKFGSYAPRVHPQYEGKHLLLHAYTVCYSWCHCLK